MPESQELRHIALKNAIIWHYLSIQGQPFPNYQTNYGITSPMQNFLADEATYHKQLSEKQNKLRALFAPYFTVEFDTYSSPLQHYRSRAEFRVWHDGDDLYHIMFDPETKEKYRVDQFPVAIKTINSLMKLVMEKLKGNPLLRRKLFQIDYLSGLSGETVISLLYHKPLDEEWLREIRKIRDEIRVQFKVDFVGRSRKQKELVDHDYITETLSVHGKPYQYMHIENSFTQPNPYINQTMIEWCLDKTSGNNTTDLLEFYCGAGNFSIPLAQNFRKVVGTEISRTSVLAANHNIAINKTDNVFIARMSSEEFSEFYKTGQSKRRLQGAELEDLDISTILVDPPRAGLDDGTLELIRDYQNIIYISCNPDTLINNVAALSSTHRVKHLALFDQFPYTHHIETGVVFERK